MLRHAAASDSRHWIATIALILLALPGAPRALGQGIMMTGGLEMSQAYKPDEWQPVHFDFRNDTDQSIDGSAVLPLADARAPSLMNLPVSVPARSRVRIIVSGYFQRPAPTAQQKRQGIRPPLSIAELRAADGQLLARTEILGFPIAATAADESSAEPGELLLLVNQRTAESDDAHDVDSLIANVARSSGVPLAVASTDVRALPRISSAMHTVKAIVLEGVDPETLDQAQRLAMLEYLRGGGVVVLSQPIDAVGRAGNWLAPLMPVRLVGARMAKQIKVAQEGPELKLRQPLDIVEAIEGDGQVLLRDRDYVHVAIRRVGLGKVVFTSFPINGLDESQPEASMLWEQLLSVKYPQWEPSHSQLGEVRHQVLSSMIGRKVAPWGVAAGVAGGYLLLILAAQAMFFGAARPRAFVVSVGAALVLSGVLVAMGMARRGDQTLQSARLTILDVTGDGGAWRHETLALIGAEKSDFQLQAANENVMIRPAIADERDRPTIRQQPFTIEQAGVHSERIERVWEASAPADPLLKLRASGRFGADGLSLEVQNDLSEALTGPLIIWNHRTFACTDLPAGRSTSVALHLNPRGDFTNTSMLTSEQSKRRGQIVKAAITPANESQTPAEELPVLIGWINEKSSDALIRTPQGESIDEKSMVMVRTPLQIESLQVGAKISVPAALVKLDSGKLPYDRATGESVPSQEQGQWMVGFSPPTELGQVRPTRVTFEARLAFPGHTLLVRSGQCADGKPKSNDAGALVAEWGREVGNKQVSFDCTPADFDREGRVWLLLDIRQAGATSGSTVPWQIKDLGMKFEAEVVAPPKPLVLDAQDNH